MEAVCMVHSLRDLLSTRGGGLGVFVSDLGHVQHGAGNRSGLTVRDILLLGLLFDICFLPLLDQQTL